jgi:hypothetical protein
MVLESRAWVGPCSPSVSGLVPGTRLEDASSEEFLRALTRVLWRESLADGVISVSAEWNIAGDFAEVVIRDSEGNELIAHVFSEFDEDRPSPRDLFELQGLEFTFDLADPPVDWLIRQVEYWLGADEEDFRQNCDFPGLDPDAWNESTEQEQAAMASAARARLVEAIASRDAHELSQWVEAASFQGDSYMRIQVTQWLDGMTWKGLDEDARDHVRTLLRLMLAANPDSGCDALLLLANLNASDGDGSTDGR